MWNLGRSIKKEPELRASQAADLFAKSQSSSAITIKLAEVYCLSKRQARRINAAGIALIVEDFD